MEVTQPYVQYMYSYPHKTAYRKLEQVSLKDHIGKLEETKNSLYVHIPYCQAKCGYCNLFSVAGKKAEDMKAYVDTMERQAEAIRAILPPKARFDDLVIGGGTPLLLPEEQLKRLFQIAETYFGIGKEVPKVIETSPNQTTPEKLKRLKEAGVTRVSMGVQSFQEEELRGLHRIHTVDTARNAIRLISAERFRDWNLDLIYGIPGQTKESFRASILEAVSFGPTELFVYPLYVKSGTKLHQEQVRQSKEAHELYELARDLLEEQGYQQVSMRRFVREKKPMISCGFDSTLSIGCGGRSYIGNLHFCSPYAVSPKSCQNRLSDYLQTEDFYAITNGYFLSEEEVRRRYVIKNILFQDGIDQIEYREQFRGALLEDYPILTDWIHKGWLIEKAGRIFLTSEGMGLSDYLGPMLISEEVKSKMEGWVEA